MVLEVDSDFFRGLEGSEEGGELGGGGNIGEWCRVERSDGGYCGLRGEQERWEGQVHYFISIRMGRAEKKSRGDVSS